MRHPSQRSLRHLGLVLIAALLVSACGASGAGPDPEPSEGGGDPTAGSESGSDEQRPDWLPDDFPLPDDADFQQELEDPETGVFYVNAIVSQNDEAAVTSQIADLATAAGFEVLESERRHMTLYRDDVGTVAIDVDGLTDVSQIRMEIDPDGGQ